MLTSTYITIHDTFLNDDYDNYDDDDFGTMVGYLVFQDYFFTS